MYPGDRKLAQLKGEERARYVARTFGRIARRYDLLNTVMSAGRHYAWRRLATRMAAAGQSGPALDVATGTADFAVELARMPQITDVVGVDFSSEMMRVGREKAERHGLTSRVTFATGDVHELPFADDAFACATVGFGVRNFTDVPRSLREMVRVLRPGGRLSVLEIVPLEGRGPFKKLFPVYFRYVTPLIGTLLAGDREAYTYLPESVQAFRTARELADLMREAGFSDIEHRSLALGTVAVLSGATPRRLSGRR